MVTILFRTRVKPGFDAELQPLGARMYEIASSMPGFVSYRDYQAADGESLSLVEFESLETLQAWRDHPEHRAAQKLGRERYFSQYNVQVLSTLRQYAFSEGERTPSIRPGA